MRLCSAGRSRLPGKQVRRGLFILLPKIQKVLKVVQGCSKVPLTRKYYDDNMQKKLLMLLGFHACWGLLLALSISNYGLGVSTDATAYMFTGMNWVRGNGLVDFSGGA